MKETIEGLATFKRESRQLRRLETLIDVVFAIVIWRAFMLIPRPGEGDWHWDSITAMLTSEILTFIIVMIGVVVAIVYWLQNNALFGNLDRTDGFHTALSILQIFFLLLFLYSIHDVGNYIFTQHFNPVHDQFYGYVALVGESIGQFLHLFG